MMDILIDGDTGEMRRLRWTGHCYRKGEKLTSKHPTRKALEIGQKVLAVCAHHNDHNYPYELDEIVRCECGKMVFINWIHKKIEPVEPPETVGEMYVNSWSEQWTWMRQVDKRLKAIEEQK